VAALLQDFDRRFESDSNPERKHLLHQLVKEVRVHSRDTAEVWYAFPQPAEREGRTVDSHIWLGGLVSVRTTKRGPKVAWPLGAGAPSGPHTRPSLAPYRWITTSFFSLDQPPAWIR